MGKLLDSELLKKIWFSKMTLIITVIQFLSPFIFKTNFKLFSLIYFLSINILVTFLINVNLQWLEKKGMVNDRSRYFREAPCTFQALKFAIGMLASVIIAIVNTIHAFNGIENYALEIIVSWYFVPLIMVFVSAASIDVGLNGKQSYKEKIKKALPFIQSFFLSFFERNSNGKIVITAKSLASWIMFFLLIIATALYYLSKFMNLS